MKKDDSDFQLFLNSRLDPIALGIDEAGFERCAPGHHFGPAVREYYLFHFVVRGKGRYTVNGRTYDVFPGMMFQIKPGETTYYQADEKDPWVYYWIGFHGSEAKETLEKLGIASYYIFPVAATETMEETFRSLKDGDENPSSISFSLLAVLYGVFALLIRQYATKSVVQKHTRHDLLDRVLFYIDSHLDQSLLVSDLSTIFHVERSHLFRVFKDTMGISPKEYILNARYKRACYLFKRPRTIGKRSCCQSRVQ